MGLQRYNPVSHNPLQYDPEMDECADGEYYRAADVDALLARIRAAVVAERNAAAADTGNASGWIARTMKARKALDALLAGGGE